MNIFVFKPSPTRRQQRCVCSMFLHNENTDKTVEIVSSCWKYCIVVRKFRHVQWFLNTIIFLTSMCYVKKKKYWIYCLAWYLYIYVIRIVYTYLVEYIHHVCVDRIHAYDKVFFSLYLRFVNYFFLNFKFQVWRTMFEFFPTRTIMCLSFFSKPFIRTLKTL